MTQEETRVLEEIMSSMYKNRDDIVEALATVRHDEFLHYFPKHQLAMQFVVATNTWRVVGTAYATPVKCTDVRKFRNGAGTPTQVTGRLEALQESLKAVNRAIEELPKMLNGEKEGA